MDQKRISHWTEELNALVDTESKGDDRAKIHWLVDHIKEYLQRWIGFACMDRLSVEDTLKNDVFCIIIGATSVIEARLSPSDKNEWFPVNEWDQFINSLELIQTYPKKENLSFVADCFNRAYEALPTQAS